MNEIVEQAFTRDELGLLASVIETLDLEPVAQVRKLCQSYLHTRIGKTFESDSR